jgi:hypothetical protein
MGGRWVGSAGGGGFRFRVSGVRGFRASMVGGPRKRWGEPEDRRRRRFGRRRRRSDAVAPPARRGRTGGGPVPAAVAARHVGLGRAGLKGSGGSWASGAAAGSRQPGWWRWRRREEEGDKKMSPK